MRQIHLIKAAHVLPFVQVLKNSGAPIEKYGERTGLSIGAVYMNDGVIGEYSAWRFIDLAAKREKLELFGYDVASRFPVHSVDGLGGMRMRHAANLKELLESFIEDAQSESTGCPYQLIPGDEGLWFERGQMFGENKENWQVEQYMIAIIIQIIQLCTGPNWLPPEIRVSSKDTVQPIPIEWKDIQITWGNSATAILVPTKDLDRPLIKPATRTATASQAMTALSFKELVRTQVLTKNIGIENASLQTGLSEKTLKRRLKEDGTSYSKILDEVRFDLARSKLEQADLTIQEISYELGYEHQANFTRAFKRISGITPLQYRNRLS